MDTIRYILAVLVWATFPPAVVFWFLVHPFIGYWRRAGGPFHAYTIVVPVCLLMAGALLRWNPVAGTDLGMSWPAFGIGFGLYLVAWFIERRVRRELDFRTLVGVPELRWEATRVPRIPTIEEFIGEDGESEDDDAGDDPDAATDADAAQGETPPGPQGARLSDSPPDPRGRLITEGIYARIRHPRFAAVMVGVWGWALMSNHGTSYVVAALLTPALLGVIHFEEKELVDRFGDDYRSYRERVPALIPGRR